MLFFRKVVDVTWQQRFLLRAARKVMTAKKFSRYSIHVNKGNNQPVMFVRAPKHFKSGKQHIKFFNAVRYHSRVLRLPGSTFLLKQTSNIFHILAQKNPTPRNDVLTSRISIKARVKLLYYMAGVIFAQLIINAIIFSFIFWILTFAAKSLFSNKYYDYKLNFYECGFKNITKKKISYEINYIMLVLFLLLYDGEFLVLIPFVLNTGCRTFQIYLCFIIFVAWLVIALLFDYALSALDWQV